MFKPGDQVHYVPDEGRTLSPVEEEMRGKDLTVRKISPGFVYVVGGDRVWPSKDFVSWRTTSKAAKLETPRDVAARITAERFTTQSFKDTNPKTVFGQAKPPLGLVPGSFLVLVAEALRDGSDKYGPANWRNDPVSASTYMDATERHFQAWKDGEEVCPLSGVHHLAHAATNLAIIIDAQACETLIDDRPPPAPTGQLIRDLTRDTQNG